MRATAPASGAPGLEPLRREAGEGGGDPEAAPPAPGPHDDGAERDEVPGRIVRQPPPSLPPGQLYRAAWGFYLLLALAAVVWIGWREKVIPLELFLDPDDWWLDLGAGVGSGLVLVGLWRLAARGIGLARSLEDRLGALLGSLTRSEVIALAVISGLAEELFFRGAVQGSWGFFWATALFALLHTGPEPSFRFWTLFALVAGALFGGLMLWRGNLLAPITAHFVVNAVNLHRIAAAPPAPAAERDLTS